MRTRQLLLVACAVGARTVLLVPNVHTHSMNPSAVTISIASEIGVDGGFGAHSDIDRKLAVDVVTLPLMASGKNLALSHPTHITPAAY